MIDRTNYILPMPPLSRYVWIVCLLFTCSACDEFLDREPFDEISKTDALDDIESLELAIIGTYDILTEGTYYGESMPVYADLTGGNLKVSNTALASDIDNYQDIYNFSQQATESLLFHFIYQQLYRGLLNANNIIDVIPKLTDGSSETRRNRVLGQALTLRALFHFDLLRIYAQPYNFTTDASHIGVVMQETPPAADEQRARSSVATGYAAVITDLETAIDLLPDFSNSAFLSEQAAQALLARVLLYQGEWSRAASVATLVIESGLIDLATRVEYLSVWQNEPYTVEHIFRLNIAQFQVSASQVSDLIGVGADRPALSASDDLIALYTPDDVRLLSFQTDANGNILSTKYPFVPSTPNDIAIIRLSEVYLIRAEAFARLGRNDLAHDDLNDIRLRADPSAIPITATGEDLIAEILLEKRKELALEGHLLFDLTRSRLGVTRNDCDDDLSDCDINYPDHRFISPIPIDAIRANDLLEQNEGY